MSRKLLLANDHIEGIQKYEVYRANGGYRSVEKALKSMSPDDVVEEVKKSSSKWIKPKSVTLGKFSWQAGYGAFSVSESNVGAVANYIRNQEEHHRARTFQEEFREFLLKNKIAYDERYVWD